jgi:replicative DNA helicase
MSKDENLKLPSEILEPSILVHSLNNVSFFLKIKPYLDTNGKKNKSYFNDEKYQIIFNIISKWYDKFAKFPTRKELHILNEKMNKSDEELRFLTDTIVDKVYDEEPGEVNIEFVEKETQGFIQENRVYEAMMMSQLDISNGNYGAIADRMREAITVNFDKNLGVSIRDIDKGIEMLNELGSESTITTGIPSLDGALDGGWRGKEIYVFAATPGIGKTALLGNFAINAFLEGKKVLVYTFETADRRLLSRYYSNLIEMTKKDILMDEDSARSKMDGILGSTAGDIILKEYPANNMSSNDLMAHINDLRMYKQWKPDIIIADYILIMLANDKSLSSENSYKFYKTVTEELRNIGKALDVPILTATQINRQGQDDRGGTKAITTSKDISESRGIFDTADFFATINQPARDRELGKVMIYVDKNRNGDKGQKIKLDIDYEHMRFSEV